MDFNQLLQQAQKLTNNTQNTDKLPRVERTLPQVLQATNELHSRVTQTGAQDVQAHILLGLKGIELPKISQKLETLSARKTFEPLDPIADTDVQSFLRNEKENAILSVIEEVHKNSYQSAQHQKWEHIMNDWKQEKVKLMNALIGPSQNWIDIRKAPEQTILNEISISGKSILDNQEMAYAKEVLDYNKLILDGSLRPNLVQKFTIVAEQFNDTKVNEIWEIMKYMVNGINISQKTSDPLKYRHQKPQFIEQAKKYLENRYKLFMSTVIADHLRDAQRGGIPTTFNLVNSYVGLKFNNQINNNIMGLQDGHLDGKPLWPLVYYSLRCGDLQSALKCMELAGPGHEDLVQALDDKFKKPDQKMNTKLELQIKMQYKRQIRNATDPYKRAVYCILGCCDVTEQHPEVAKTSDDFLWIQLSMIRNDLDDSSDVLTYSKLQSLISEQYGEKYFNANEQPHLYFQVLALTGQFEKAIEFLSRFERYRTHAVHIAIALNELFIIGGPRNVQEPLLSCDIEDPLPLRRLNIARLIMLYVRKFEITDPAEALQYFFFLRNLKNPEGKNLFLVCVTDLAIECRDYDLIYGKIQQHGNRSRGLIDQFESAFVDRKKACEMIADELVKKGLFEDAIKLYDLAENKTQALYHLSILLSQVVHQQNKPGSLRERLQLMASDFIRRCTSEQCEERTYATFWSLYNLLDFFDLYHAKKDPFALKKLNELEFIPNRMESIDFCVGQFKNIGAQVSKVLPDLLLAAMDIIYRTYTDLKERIPDNDNESIQDLRNRARAITNMAATIPYRLPGDTNSRLIQTEILMH